MIKLTFEYFINSMYRCGVVLQQIEQALGFLKQESPIHGQLQALGNLSPAILYLTLQRKIE